MFQADWKSTRDGRTSPHPLIHRIPLFIASYPIVNPCSFVWCLDAVYSLMLIFALLSTVQSASLLLLALRTFLIKVLRQQLQAKDCWKPSSFITSILSFHKRYPSCDTIFFIPGTVFHHVTTSTTDTRGCQKGHANGGRLFRNLRPCWLCVSGTSPSMSTSDKI